MSLPDPIRIEGLVDFQAALKKMDGESQKQLRVVFNTVAETIAKGASRRVPVRTGRARSSLRVQSGQRDAKVVGGSGRAPYYGWLEFGGVIGKSESQRRPFVTGGRYMYPALSANRETITKALEKGLDDLARSAGLAVD